MQFNVAVKIIVNIFLIHIVSLLGMGPEHIYSSLNARNKILLVEDDLQCAKSLALFLGSHNMDVHVCTSGSVALQTINSYYDLILLDHQLSDMSGLDVINRIRDPQSCPPIILWTGACTNEEQIKAWSGGMVIDVILKPTSVQLLLVRIQNRLMASRGLLIRQYETRVGALVLNLKQSIVSFYGHQLDLSPKEFSLLTYLIQHLDCVVDKNLIMNYVYRDDLRNSNLPDSKILDVVVCKLRNKMQKLDRHRTYIHTVWARGYIVYKNPELHIETQMLLVMIHNFFGIHENINLHKLDEVSNVGDGYNNNIHLGHEVWNYEGNLNSSHNNYTSNGVVF